MRIDQLLWFLRYYKSRSLATNACKKGHARLNSEILKPSRDVLPLDVISIRKNQIHFKFKVLDIPKSRVSAKIVDIYRQDLTSKNAFDQKLNQSLNKTVERDQGLGRTTKKDRREIDGFKGK